VLEKSAAAIVMALAIAMNAQTTDRVVIPGIRAPAVVCPWTTGIFFGA
jgi:hypothetical protein